MEKDIEVILVTYNQKNYIEKAFKSILEQKGVSFRILVHDDCSTDGTKQIIEEYQKRFPSIIFPIFEEERVFPKLGFNRMLYEKIVPHINAKYIAYCDGDDYWCDSSKLLKQYEFMECNKECGMCFCSSFVENNDGTFTDKRFIKNCNDTNIEDLLVDNDGIFIATSSIFLKSEIFCDFKEWRLAFPVEDYPLYINASLYGPIHAIKEPMSVYRKFATGSWSCSMRDNNKRLKNVYAFIKAFKKFDEFTNHKYYYLTKLLYRFYDFKIAYYSKNLEQILSKKNRTYFKRFPLKTRFSYRIQYRFPRIYRFLKK